MERCQDRHSSGPRNLSKDLYKFLTVGIQIFLPYLELLTSLVATSSGLHELIVSDDTTKIKMITKYDPILPVANVKLTVVLFSWNLYRYLAMWGHRGHHKTILRELIRGLYNLNIYS